MVVSSSFPLCWIEVNACSRNDALGLYTNQTHREWIYRQAITFGRHVIGYEVQKVLAAVDWFARQDAGKPLPVGVVGWGEGGADCPL